MFVQPLSTLRDLTKWKWCSGHSLVITLTTVIHGFQQWDMSVLKVTCLFLFTHWGYAHSCSDGLPRYNMLLLSKDSGKIWAIESIAHYSPYFPLYTLQRQTLSTTWNKKSDVACFRSLVNTLIIILPLSNMSLQLISRGCFYIRPQRQDITTHIHLKLCWSKCSQALIILLRSWAC